MRHVQSIGQREVRSGMIPGRQDRSENQTHKRRIKLVAAVVATDGAMSLRSMALAQDNWIAGSSNWNNAANWSSGIPGAGDTVDILNDDTTSPVITYDYAGAAVTLGSLTVSNSGGGTESLVFNSSSPVLSSLDENTGDSGNGSTQAGVGVLTQSGGMNTLSGTLSLGSNANDAGTYILSGTGSLVTGGIEYVGINGSGTFIQSGGTNTTLGEDSGGNGLWVGNTEGPAIYNQTGGENYVANGQLLVDGTYFLSGTGTIDAAREGGFGVYIQSGGNNNVSGTLIDDGQYFLSGGSWSLGGSETLGGFSNNGVFTQSGGTAQINNGQDLNLGFFSTSTYTLSGSGSLIVSGTEYLGAAVAGVANFFQSGGSNTTSNLQIDDSTLAAMGNYTMTGGSLDVTGLLTIETPQLGRYGTLSIANVTATAGAVNIEGGRLLLTDPVGAVSAGDLLVTGSYTQSAGVLGVAISGLLEGSQYSVLDVLGAVALDGGTLDVSLADGFVPSPGETFEVIDAGSLTGSFSNVVLPATGAYAITYEPDGVFVTAIPEPGCVGLLAAGSLFALARRRRRA